VGGTKAAWIWRSAVRITVALLAGTAFHVAWVATFIFAASQGAPGILRAMLWLIGPLVTAIGFGLGLTLWQRHDPQRQTGFARAFMAAVSGCAIGALVMSPIGPMFVGLGILGGGTVAVAIWVASDRGAVA
jgi:hypothetical protein